MKKILCYGDSNTFGFNPKDGSRFDENSRWSGILKKNLENEFEVIEEGLNNRTGFVDNPDGFNHSGLRYFPELLEKFTDVEILILALGTNDLQFRYNIDFQVIEQGLLELINLAIEKGIVTILIPSVVLDSRVLRGPFSYQFDETSTIKSHQMSKIYKRIAQNTKSFYFDFNSFVKTSDFDGLHYDEKAHKIIAQKLSEYIRTIVL